MKCEHCGKEHSRKRFCSNKCKDRWHNRNNTRGFGVAMENEADYSDIEAMAGSYYAAGWGEDGWRDDDSGVSAF